MATIEMKKPFNLPFNGFDESGQWDFFCISAVYEDFFSKSVVQGRLRLKVKIFVSYEFSNLAR